MYPPPRKTLQGRLLGRLFGGLSASSLEMLQGEMVWGTFLEGICLGALCGCEKSAFMVPMSAPVFYKVHMVAQ